MRLRSCLVALAIVAYAVPALAQQGGGGVEVRDHRKKDQKDKGNVKVDASPAKKEAKVSGFAPTSGRVGTVVTITGENFVPQTKVHVGGRPVKSISTTATQIQFAIPQRYDDGVITLKHPGMGQDVPVGTFTVIVDPVILGFQPASGPPGTRVEISGTGFAQGDQILFNGRPLAISELTPARMVVVIPPDGKTDFFTVSRPGVNYAATSKQKFTVVQPAPVVSGIAPASGPPGTNVRITGQNFTPDDKVFYGAIPARIAGITPTTIDVEVPANAKVSAAFLVKTNHGNAQSAVFNLVLPPQIGRFAPEWGPVGAQVEIFGDHFVQSDQVWLGNVQCRLVSFTENKLVVQIPAGAVTAQLTVRRSGQVVATSQKAFEVVGAPTINGFTPALGPVGTRVTIGGTGFEPNMTVYYGAQKLGIVGRGPSSVDVIVPQNATNQPFVVETRGGRAQSAASFQVITFSTIVSVTPTQGVAGTKVQIGVQHPGQSDAFFLGAVKLPIVERSAQGYVVTIPANAQSGVIEWESYGKRFSSKWRFQVLQPAAITGYAPTSGVPGTQVTISGANFTAQAKVFFGNTPCQIVKRQLPGTLVIVIPPTAAGADYLWVEDGGVRVKTAAPFTVVAPVTVTGFSPASGPPGTQVTINGTGFTAATTVTFNGAALAVTSRTAGSLVVTIPANAKSDYFWVADGNQKARSAAQFAVTAPPPPPPPPAAKCTLNLAPASGPAGSQVTITATGCSFGGKIRAWFGTAELQIVSVNATTLVVKLPANATGSQNISVEMDDGGGVATRRRTVEKFTVGKAGVVVPAKPGNP
jgi:hypothetical protein